MTKSLETKRSFLSVSRIVLAVLMCLLFTGCALLDIKDKGGMVNPDAVSEEETGVAENETENDMSRFMKRRQRRSLTQRSLQMAISRSVSRSVRQWMGKSKKRFPVALG